MNGSSIQPERAWNTAPVQRRLDMPKATFDTWVNNTSFVAFEEECLPLAPPAPTDESGWQAA
jgi:hypothetical protein